MTEYQNRYLDEITPLDIPRAETILACMIMFHEDGLIDNCEDESDLVEYVIMREVPE